MKLSFSTIVTATILLSAHSSAGIDCGPNIGSCPPNQCCSLAGFCGTTPDYCISPDCQFRYGPACDANRVPMGSNTTSIPRKKTGSILYGAEGIYGCAQPGNVALTFDDGPGPYTSHVLDLLDKYNAKATFFISGNNNGKQGIDNPNQPWPNLIQRMYKSGHQIASHTWSHADLSKLSSSERRNEMIKNEMAIRNILGVIPTYMRPPYSSCSAESGCEGDMTDLGYHVVYFDLDTQDYLNDAPDLIGKSKSIFDQAISRKTSSTSDILAISHDVHQQTSEQLVEFMLQKIKDGGYRAVTVGTCLGDPVENWYRRDQPIARLAKLQRF